MIDPHPSPKLVRDLMTVGVQTCTPDTPMAALARLMLEKGCEAVVVLAEGHALGVVGQDEIVSAIHRPDWQALSAEQVMREGVPQVPADIPIEAAAQLMHDQGVRCLFLMHHAGGIEYPAAQITYWHLLRCAAAESDADLLDLGMHASRQLPLETFVQRRDDARRKVGKR